VVNTGTRNLIFLSVNSQHKARKALNKSTNGVVRLKSARYDILAGLIIDAVKQKADHITAKKVSNDKIRLNILVIMDRSFFTVRESIS